jgi:hypothetical protein
MRVALVCAAAICVGLIACAWVAGLPSDYAMVAADSGTDADSSTDADSASSDETSSGLPVKCQGMWVDASNCATCPDPYLCTDNSRNDCVADCASCKMTWAPCVLCAGGATPFGFCKAFDTDGVLRCGIPSGDRCTCDGGSTDDCPVFGQVCVGGAGARVCLMCGEPNTVGAYCKHTPQNGAMCQGGGMCQ